MITLPLSVHIKRVPETVRKLLFFTLLGALALALTPYATEVYLQNKNYHQEKKQLQGTLISEIETMTRLKLAQLTPHNKAHDNTAAKKLSTMTSSAQVRHSHEVTFFFGETINDELEQYYSLLVKQPGSTTDDIEDYTTQLTQSHDNLVKSIQSSKSK